MDFTPDVFQLSGEFGITEIHDLADVKGGELATIQSLFCDRLKQGAGQGDPASHGDESFLLFRTGKGVPNVEDGRSRGGMVESAERRQGNSAQCRIAEQGLGQFHGALRIRVQQELEGVASRVGRLGSVPHGSGQSRGQALVLKLGAQEGGQLANSGVGVMVEAKTVSVPRLRLWIAGLGF